MPCVWSNQTVSAGLAWLPKDGSLFTVVALSCHNWVAAGLCSPVLAPGKPDQIPSRAPARAKVSGAEANHKLGRATIIRQGR